MAVDSDDRTLFVANLHKSVNEEILYELFLQAGPIERVSIPNTNNKNSRYGFVTYLHLCSVDYAIQLYKGTKLFKSELIIKRKGERCGNDHQSSDRFNDNMRKSNIIHDQPAVPGYSYLPSLLEVPNGNSNFKKKKMNLKLNLKESSLKGHWSDRNRSYNCDLRRNHSSRSFESRHRHRDRLHSNTDYNKQYQDRKRRY